MHGNRLKLSPTLNNKTWQNKRNFLFKNSGTKVDLKKTFWSFRSLTWTITKMPKRNQNASWKNEKFYSSKENWAKVELYLTKVTELHWEICHNKNCSLIMIIYYRRLTTKTNLAGDIWRCFNCLSCKSFQRNNHWNERTTV